MAQIDLAVNTQSGCLEFVIPPDSSTKEILSNDALVFLKKLHRNFEPRRKEILEARVRRQQAINEGKDVLDFLPSTKFIRDDPTWHISPLPPQLHRRRVEITGPVDRKMVINALNSGADCYMADFEDSTAPTWQNQIAGQANLKDAIRRRIDFTAPNGKEYKLEDEVATLLVRPRGWHLDEKHLLIDGERLSGSIFDFGLYFFHNAQELLARGMGPYFYLPKLQSHLEARLWNDVFVFAQDELGIPQGTIKATVLIETIMAAFEMDEILYELKNHSSGLNAGRWDYIFSCIKTFQKKSPQTINGPFAFPDRSQITMNVPFMRAYCLSLVQTCHRRHAPAIGGMSALIPIKDDSAANEKAMSAIRDDKIRDAKDGFDGGWVAHPGLVNLAMAEFVKVLGDNSNQIKKPLLLDYVPKAENILNFQPTEPKITETGLRSNVRVGIQYLASWLAGVGCVPINNLMEDAATAEISRSQIWQWIHSSKGVLDDGRKVNDALVDAITADELTKLKKNFPNVKTFDKAADIFIRLSKSPNFEEFLTLPLYETF